MPSFNEEERGRLRSILLNPSSIREFFDMMRQAEMADLNKMLKVRPRMDPIRREITDLTIALNANILLANEVGEALAYNQLVAQSKLNILLAGLQLQRLTKEEMAQKLEEIRKELAIPPEDRQNIAWVRKYLKNASKKEGKGA